MPKLIISLWKGVCSKYPKLMQAGPKSKIKYMVASSPCGKLKSDLVGIKKKTKKMNTLTKQKTQNSHK